MERIEIVRVKIEVKIKIKVKVKGASIDAKWRQDWSAAAYLLIFGASKSETTAPPLPQGKTAR